ncbi:UPF0223 family protein [Sutcliffiella rhizosphaerae]|uniref:Uncharacterized protein n=1 Tax=Sutcliffiella rhizosphaerae TaxID=2880967 RepID=A0ABN8A423_9BACI|nr:UPF0223 family protein [Sutcliffiella rhizosphaerae]CAG9619869.1 hypothetical protein BACCIP111883_00637 [Sutcliffiella rhizosphaerae]
MEFSYPMSYDWSTDELIDVIAFYEAVEKAYTKGVERDHILDLYRRFKEIVPSKAQEKNLGMEYEEMSGFSIYKAMKKAKEMLSGEIVKVS